MNEPLYFWLGDEAELEWFWQETLEQLAREVFEIDLTDPQTDE